MGFYLNKISLNFTMKKINLLLSTVTVILMILSFGQLVDATMSQKKAKKKGKLVKPPGVASEITKLPNDCQVCRLMVEEIYSIMKGEEQELTEEQKKKKKREARRKSKAEKKRDKSMPMFTAIEDVCDKMLQYSPQSRKKKFRYLKTSVLADTQTIMTAQLDGDEASTAINKKYENFRHPETNRLMEKCDEYINKYENDLLKWQQTEEEKRAHLIDFLCEDRIVGNKEGLACFHEESARSDLWRKTFDMVLEKRPELKDQNFDV